MARGELTDSATEKVGDFSEASSDEATASATRVLFITVCRLHSADLPRI